MYIPQEEHDHSNPQPATQSQSHARLLLERFLIGLVALVSLLFPLIIGLLFYLAISDGITVNAGDPFHEARLWMIQESHGATGLGFTSTAPVSSGETAHCAFTTVLFLKWDRSLRLETDASYCRCYELKNGTWEDLHSTCK